jgi:hypothetical protein
VFAVLFGFVFFYLLLFRREVKGIGQAAPI